MSRKILFMGDSVTDCGKKLGSGSQVIIGQGYPLMVAGRLGADYPAQYEFVNSGISGHRVVDLYARIKCDAWNHKPDVFSILIGINDVWHELAGNGVEADRFYTVYKMLVEDSMKVLPGVKMILMEPFVLRGKATDEHWDYFFKETKLRAEATKQIAAETRQHFLPLQNVFDEATKLAPGDYWIDDGVHPFPAGHQLIADAWIELFKKEIM